MDWGAICIQIWFVKLSDSEKCGIFPDHAHTINKMVERSLAGGRDSGFANALGEGLDSGICRGE